ncbi:hypothetical protein GGD61_008167 [Bradyrhizobium sp. SBR1B]|nr:hypothetical protein [Bradyrhizobium sp. SBR1B]
MRSSQAVQPRRRTCAKSEPATAGGVELVRRTGTSAAATAAPPLYGPSIYGDVVDTPVFLADGQIAYNWQKNGWASGVELDASGAASDGTNTCLAACGSVVSANCKAGPKGLPRKPFDDCSNRSMTARHVSGTRTHRRTLWLSSTASYAVGAATSTKAQWWKLTTSFGNTSIVVYDIGWFSALGRVGEASGVTRRSTCTKRLASIASPERAPTCRERRLDGSRESRVREIRMPGLTSGDWKRSHGPK